MNSYNPDLSANDKYFKTTFIVIIDAKQEGGVPICCFYWLKEGGVDICWSYCPNNKERSQEER